MVIGEDEAPKDEEWRTLDSTWLDLEEDDGKLFHVNVIIEEVACSGRKCPPLV
jgi:hypothetical protein